MRSTLSLCLSSSRSWSGTALRRAESLYDDMATLERFGVDVQSRKGRHAGWFIGNRAFELPELKLLVDAVQSSRFITRRKATLSFRSWSGWPAYIKPGSCSDRSLWTGGSRQ